MEDTLISFETAKLAKEKGFNEKCFQHYDFDKYLSRISKSIDVVIGPYEELLLTDNLHYSAPTQSLLQTWIRDIHGIHIVMIPTVTANWTYKTLTVLSERDNDVIKGLKSVSDLPPYDNVCGKDFSTYESALEDALQKSLILIN